MDEIAAAQEQLLREFHELGDPFACYSYLLGLASLLPPMPEELKTKENTVEGCQSTVWLSCREEGGRFRVRTLLLERHEKWICKGFVPGMLVAEAKRIETI